MTNYSAVNVREVEAAWKDNKLYQNMAALTLSRQRSELIRHRERLLTAGELGEGSTVSVINPGALYFEDGFRLLLRGESDQSTWLGHWDRSWATPIWAVLDEDLALREYQYLTYRNLPPRHRPEDWRLFRYRGELFANHSVYLEREGTLLCRPGISSVDAGRGEITLRALLEPPVEAGREEKNWGFFVSADDLFCIYSVDPYVVLRINLPSGESRIEIDAGRLIPQWIDKGAPFIGSSTNPVIWDDEHYVTFVHDFLKPEWPAQRNRAYMQYGMLIDRASLRPTSIIAQPLLIGGAELGRHPGVHYTMSLVNRPDALYSFHGEGDSHSGVVLFNKEVLAELFHAHRL